MQLRDYQVEAIQQINRYLQSMPGNPLVVAPTGTGKSLIIGGFIQCHAKSARILVATIQHELVTQDASAIRRAFPGVEVGIFCASLDRFEVQSVTVGSILTLANHLDKLGVIDFLVVDEAHAVSPGESAAFNRLIKALKDRNHKLRIIGFTATPYRMDQGLLTNGKSPVFTDICYEIRNSKMIREGYMAPIMVKEGFLLANMADVPIDPKTKDYDAAEMARRFSTEPLWRALNVDLVKFSARDKRMLFFCSNIAHAEMTRSFLEMLGLRAAALTGKTPSKVRAQMLADFHNGELDAITNCGVLTTGFDEAEVDLVVYLRATKSPALFAQIAGRGTRPKSDGRPCLFLDYGGNFAYHGPLELLVDKAKADALGNVQPMPSPRPRTKTCAHCKEIIGINATVCRGCNAALVAIPKQSVTYEHKSFTQPGNVWDAAFKPKGK